MYLQYSNRGVLFIMIYVDEAHPIEQNDFPPDRLLANAPAPNY